MKRIISAFGMAFILSFVWEISQAFLYAPHYVGISGFVIVHLRASLGDIVIIFLILCFDAFLFKDYNLKKINFQRMLSIVCFGFMMAILIEKYALNSGRWSYDSLMPIIPWINVGLTPILQMVLIPPVVAIFWSKPK